MTADWFARREIVLAMAVILSTWPFGIALGLFTQPWIAVHFGWRSMMLLAAGVCVWSLLLVTVCYRKPADDGTDNAQIAPGAAMRGLPGSSVISASHRHSWRKPAA
jgi:MFS family permease